MRRFFIALAAETKLLYKSVWSLVYFLPPVILTLLTLSSFGKQSYMDNLGSWVDCNGYTTIYTGFAALVIGVFCAQSKNELLSQMFTSVRKTNIKLLSAIIFTSSYIIIAVTVIVVYDFVKPVSFALLLDYLGYTLTLWLTQSIFFTAMGFLIGTIIESKSAYFVIVIPELIFSLFLPVFAFSYAFSLFFNIPEFVFSLLNSNIDNPLVIKSLSQGISFNSFYWYDKFFILLLGFFCYALSLYINNKKVYIKKNGFTLTGILLAFLLIAGDVTGAGLSAPKNLGFFNQGLKPKLLESQTVSGLKVKSYKMNTYLRENFMNICDMKVSYSGSGDLNNMSLKLDDSLSVDSLNVNSKPVQYKASGDSIDISGLRIKSGSTADIFVKYHGRINYAGEYGARLVYADDSCSYLPESFAWYPMLSGIPNNTVEYDINLHTGNTVVTNLNKSGSHLIGSKKGFYLSTGYYTTVTFNGTKVICGEEIARSKELKNTIDNIKKDKAVGGLDYSSQNFLGTGSNKKAAADILKNGKIVFLPNLFTGMFRDYYFDGDIIVCN